MITMRKNMINMEDKDQSKHSRYQKEIRTIKSENQKKEKMLKACLIKNKPTNKQQNIKANRASKILSKINKETQS